MPITISAGAVKELREKSGAGMMECKKALEESQGDMAKAMDWLREKGIASAAKKASRSANEGLIGVFMDPSAKKAALVEVNCETDFVAKTDDFKNLVKHLAERAFQEELDKDAVQAAASLLSKASTQLKGQKLEDEVKACIGKLGENMALARAAKLQVSKGSIGMYLHADGKLATLVALSCAKAGNEVKEEFKELARDLAMQVAGANPPAQVVLRDQISADFIAKEKEIAMVQAKATGKPEAILEKIAEGKVNKVLQEITLMEQVFIKEPTMTISQVVKQVSDKLGDTLKVEGFVRFKVGEKA